MEDWLVRVLANCKRSLERGLGPVHRAPELPLNGLISGASYIVAFRWLLREIEVAALMPEDVTFSEPDATATLKIRVSKNDQRAAGTQRTWKCT
eukprot:3319978-Amphidinium_carterae.1